MQTTPTAIAGAPGSCLSLKAIFFKIKRWLLAAAFFLCFAFFAPPAAGQVGIGYGGQNPISSNTVIYSVTFTTAQTGLSASNFSVTGSVTGAFVNFVGGSGTSWSVQVTVPNSYQSSGTIILNMVNSTGVSPGVSGLPVASQSVDDILYPLTGSMTLTSNNANPGYAKAGDIISFVVRSDHYTLNNISAVVDNQTFNGSATGPSGSGYVVLGSGAPQGPLSYAWQFVTGFGTNGNGSGTSSIIFDSQAPTVGISAPSAAIVSGGGTKSVAYTVTYADANFGSSNLTTSGITLNTTGTATGTLGISGSGTTYAVTIYNISGNGTLGISVGAGYAVDLAGNTEATGAGPSSTVTVVPNVAPSIGYAGPQGYAVNTAISPLTPSVIAGKEVFAGSGGRGVALDYNGNAYAISSSYTIVKYPAGGGSPVTAYNANGVVTNVAVAPVSSTTSTLLFGISGSTSNTLESMDVVGGVFQAPVPVGTVFSGFSAVAATHPASGPDVVAVFTDNNSNINFTARTGGVYSAPAPIANALVTVSAAVFAGGTAVALNNYQGAVKLAFVGQDNNLYYSIYSGGVWSAVAPWATPNISMSGVRAFALDAQGNVWYSSGTSLYEIAPGSTAGYAVTTLPAAASGIAFDISGNIYVNCGTEIEELQVPGNFLVTPALPAGLSINSTTGVISGTPTGLTAATNYMVTATAGANNLTAPVNIQIVTTPALSYGSAVNATPGTAITPITPTSTSIMAQTYNSTPTTFASVNAPTGLAVDIAGNVYVAATGLTLLKYGQGANLLTTISSSVKAPLAADVAGNVYAFVALTNLYQFTVFPPGSTTPSYSSNYQGEGPYIMGGAASNASGMAVDGAGDVYVASPSTNAVYEYSNGKNGGANGALGIAIGDGFTSVSGIAADAAGNVYVADAGAGTIDLMPANRGQWTTLASGLGAPASICIDGAGNLYFSDNSANTIRELPAGSTTPVLIASGLGAITAVAVDGQGNLYAADNTNNVIDKFSPSGGFFINPVLPPGLSFSGTTGVISGTPTVAAAAVNYTITAYNTLGSASATQNITITAAPPTLSYGVPRFTTGEAITPLTPTSTGVAAPGYNVVPTLIDWQFGTPFAVAVDTSLNVYVADPFNIYSGNINVSDTPADNIFINYLIPKGNGTYQNFYNPSKQVTAVAVDSTANLYINKGDGSGVSHLTPYPYASGAPVETVLAGGYAYSLATDRQGNLFGATGGSNVIQYVSSGVTATVASGFNSAVGLAIDGSGNMFVSDRGNGTLYKVPAGSSTPIAVATGFALGNSALVGPVYGRIAADGTGNIFIADAGNGVVKELPAGGGAVATVITNLQLPTGMAVDINGALYVADVGFSQVRKYTPGGGYYISPSLPAGVSFNNATGVISGTPTAATPVKDYKITAYNASGSTQIKLRFGVAAPSSSLAGLTLSAGSLSPAFASATLSYSVSALYPSTQSTVTPTPSDPNATVTVNGNAVVNGSASAPISLAVGSNNITIVVKASDGSSTQTYTVTVNRAGPSNNALLSNVGIGYVMSGGTVEAVITPSASDPNATVTVNGTTVASGAASSPIPLAAGANSIVIQVTAQDGLTKMTYKITVDGPLGSTSTLSSLAISAGTLSPAFSPGTTSYTDNVTNTVVSVTVTPTTTDPNATVTVDAAAVASGTPSGSIALNLGNNTISTVVTAQDGVTATTYTITVDRVASSNDNLSNITLSNGTLSPTFAAATPSYTAAVANGLASMTITPTAADPTATIKVNGAAVTSGAASQSLPLAVGPNTITTVVTAQDGVTKRTYTLVVTEAKSANANLALFKPSTGTLSPTFTASTTGYTESVNYAVSSMTITPATADPTATVTINGAAVTSGTASAPINLSVGANTITTVVTAQNGTTKTYTLTVTRGAAATVASLSGLTISSGTLAPGFLNTTTAYTASVPNTTTSITVTPTASSAYATITVNGTTVASGSASAQVNLNVGANVINTVVTAQNGITTKTYTITVTRAASSNDNLANLSISNGSLNQAFAAATTSYTAAVGNGLASMTVTPTTADPTATITVNGTAVTSGNPSQSLPLVVGPNTITTVVTAQDGVTKQTYTIVVTEAKSSNDNLAGLTISSGTLSPAFAIATASYTAAVGNGLASMTITPTTADPTATITVNGTAVISGTASQSLPLVVGPNTLTTIVTAQDGVTTKTYTLVVTEAKSSNDNLSAFKPSTGSLTPTFAAATTSYTESVPNTVSTMTISPTTAVSTSTVTINGKAVTSGTASGSITLSVGANTITGIVTAQNGAIKTYTLTVTRASGGADSYVPIAIGTGISVTKPTETPILANDGITVHQAISPNGDGINDFLQIDNITNYPDNRLMIMNRNGQLVYEASGYDNSSKVFDGHSNKNGQMQLPGTYFYQLDYTANGITKHKTGFLILKY